MLTSFAFGLCVVPASVQLMTCHGIGAHTSWAVVGHAAYFLSVFFTAIFVHERSRLMTPVLSSGIFLAGHQEKEVSERLAEVETERACQEVAVTTLKAQVTHRCSLFCVCRSWWFSHALPKNVCYSDFGPTPDARKPMWYQLRHTRGQSYSTNSYHPAENTLGPTIQKKYI